MSSELVRRSTSGAISRRRDPYGQALDAIHGETGVQVTIDRAIAGVGEQAMFDVMQVKQTQRQPQ